jgi:oxygen-dependent protoporphyrinogen oxidase
VYPVSPKLDAETYAQVLGPMHPDIAGLMRVTANRLATEPDRLSGHIGTVDTVGIWGLRRPNVYGGTEEVPRALHRVLGDRALLGATVEAIEQDPKGVSVHMQGPNGSELMRARVCVAAIPAPEVLRTIQGLPEAKIAALRRVRYGPFLVLGLFTNETTRMPWDDIYAMAVADRSFCMFFNPASVFRRPGGERRAGGALVVYAAGDRAAELMDRSDEQVAQAYLADLEQLFPKITGLIAGTVVQRWPLGVPVAAPGRAGLQPQLAATVGRIVFTGDYVVHPGMDSAVRCSEVAARTATGLLAADS